MGESCSRFSVKPSGDTTRAVATGRGPLQEGMGRRGLGSTRHSADICLDTGHSVGVSVGPDVASPRTPARWASPRTP